jgi:hypothetical protein
MKALVVGDAKRGVTTYPVVERAFDPTLPVEQRLLAFDRYWDGYDLQGNVPQVAKKIYTYTLAPADLQSRLQDLARAAYLAVGGRSYGRVDIRADQLDLSVAQFCVLEVNSQPGLSFDTDSSSLGSILHLSQVTPQLMLSQLVALAK